MWNSVTGAGGVKSHEIATVLTKCSRILSPLEQRPRALASKRQRASCDAHAHDAESNIKHAPAMTEKGDRQGDGGVKMESARRASAGGETTSTHPSAPSGSWSSVAAQGEKKQAGDVACYMVSGSESGRKL